MKRLNWYKIQPLNSSCKPSERWGHSSCVIGNDLVVFGGYADSNYMNDLWIFNTITLQWKIQQTYGNVPEPRSNATLNYDKQQNRLIMFGGGGQGKKRFSSVHALDWNTKKWKQIIPTNQENGPWERTYHISQIIENYLLIFGGQNFADLNDIWLFDLKQNKWKEVQFQAHQLKPSPRRFHTSIVRNNQLIIIGGCHNKYQSLKDIFKMNFTQFLKTKDVSCLKWEKINLKSTDFIPRWGHSSTYNPLNDQIYIFGGRFSSDLQDIVTLDLNRGVSNKIYVNNEEIPSPRRRHSANFIGSSLIVFGGFNGSYYNDLYSIKLPSQIPMPKYTKDSTIQFTNFLKKDKNFVISFLQKYFESYHQVYEQLAKEYSNQQIDELFTQIVRQYSDPKAGYQERINKLIDEGYLKQKTKIYNSKMTKIENIRNRYSVQNILREKSPLSLKSKNIFKQVSIEPPSELACQIVFLQNQQFDQYLINHRKQVKRTLLGYYQTYVQMEDQNTLYIQFEGIGKISVDPIIIFYNEYFYNCFKESNRIVYENVSKQNIRVFQVGLNYLQTCILVVPADFTLEQWENLAQFGLYYCAQNLITIIQKFLISKVDKNTISKLSYFACNMQMKRLMTKCSMTIIERQQYEFFLKNSSSKKITPEMFSKFQKKFYSSLDNFIYPAQFQKQITYQFEINKLNILLKNIHKIKEISNEKIKVAVQNIENQEKENEQNSQFLTIF